MRDARLLKCEGAGNAINVCQCWISVLCKLLFSLNRKKKNTKVIQKSSIFIKKNIYIPTKIYSRH